MCILNCKMWGRSNRCVVTIQPHINFRVFCNGTNFRCMYTKLHGVTSKKNAVLIFTAELTSSNISQIFARFSYCVVCSLRKGFLVQSAAPLLKTERSGHYDLLWISVQVLLLPTQPWSWYWNLRQGRCWVTPWQCKCLICLRNPNT
jgi:hypothetical protein